MSLLAVSQAASRDPRWRKQSQLANHGPNHVNSIHDHNRRAVRVGVCWRRPVVVHSGSDWIRRAISSANAGSWLRSRGNACSYALRANLNQKIAMA